MIARAEAPGCILATATGGPEQLEAALAAIRDRTMIGGRAPGAVFLGLTAVNPGTPGQPIGEQIAARLWPSSARTVEGDGLIAWAGATGGAPGVCAMAGTGSVVVAVNERGERADTGGYWYLFGDPGSGWHIGNLAVRRMLQRWDRDRSVSPLGTAVLAAVGATRPPEIPDLVYGEEIERVAIARLARIVAELAGEGDVESAEILGTSAAEFAVDVASAIDRLDWEHEPVLVAMLGRVFRAGEAYRRPFVDALARRTPRRVQVVEPALSGLGGAALLALRLGGIEPDSRLVRALVGAGLGPEDD